MTVPDEVGRPDPRSLPLFTSRVNPIGSAGEPGGTPRRPGRVRSDFSLRLVGDPTGPEGARAARSAQVAPVVVDWALVAAFRTQASEQLTKALGDDRAHTNKATQEALGRSIILELLESAAAEAVTNGRPSWTVAEGHHLNGRPAAEHTAALVRVRCLPVAQRESGQRLLGVLLADQLLRNQRSGCQALGPGLLPNDKQFVVRHGTLTLAFVHRWFPPQVHVPSVHHGTGSPRLHAFGADAATPSPTSARS